MPSISVREDVLEALEALFTNMTVGEPVADPYTVDFSVVTRKPLTEGAPRGKKSALGIYEGTAAKQHRASMLTEAVLRVTLEFHVYVEKGTDSSTLLNKYMAEIERLLHDDQTLGGNCVNIIMEGDEVNIDGIYDKQVSGAMFIALQYRYQTGDPRRKR